MTRRTVEYLGPAVSSNQYPSIQLPEFAIIGRSNVGKSSLINTLLGSKKFARISKTPGKTRLLHFFQVADTFIVVDLPGYGYAKVPPAERNKWDKIATQYLSIRKQLTEVILLIDARHLTTKLDKQMITWLNEYQKPYTVVATKIDKISRNKRSGTIQKLGQQLGVAHEETRILTFSAKTREGKSTLFNHLLQVARDKAVVENNGHT